MILRLLEGGVVVQVAGGVAQRKSDRTAALASSFVFPTTRLEQAILLPTDSLVPSTIADCTGASMRFGKFVYLLPCATFSAVQSTRTCSGYPALVLLCSNVCMSCIQGLSTKD